MAQHLRAQRPQQLQRLQGQAYLRAISFLPLPFWSRQTILCQPVSPFADSIIASHHVFADFFDLMISSVIDLTQAHAALRLRLLLTHSLESSKTKCSGDSA